MPRFGPLLAALGLMPALGCSLLVDLDGLSAGGAAAGGAGAGNQGGSGGAGPGPGPGAGGSAGAITFTDDELEGEFGEGTFKGTAWAGDRVALAPNTLSGELESRVFDAGTDAAAWQSLAWTAAGPYGKPLPDQGAAETGYLETAIDMRDNVLLLHLDGSGGVGSGAVLKDTSGYGNDAALDMPTGASVSFVPGPFGQAIEDESFSHARINVAAGGALELGTSDFTWALWVRTTEDCAGNKVHLGVEDLGVDRAHLWMGCTDSAVNQNCPSSGDVGGRAGGTFRSQHDAVDGASLCGETQINDGAWHHLAVVKTGHANALLTLYVDGKAENLEPASFVAPILFFDAPELAIGAFSNGTYPAVGTFDEVAIWRRALTDAEVFALYRRGAMRMSFQVRICDDAGCAQGTGYVGPNLDPSAWFVESAGALSPGTALGFKDMPPGRFLQYKAMLESDRVDDSPGLLSVSVTALP